MKLKTIHWVCAFAAILGSCGKRGAVAARGEAASDRGLTVVTSAREPKSDADALKTVRINMTPAPQVVYRHYEGGLDDNMKLVIRFPAHQVADFWSDGPWLKEDAVTSSGDGSAGAFPRIPEHGDPEWLKWKSSPKGHAAEASLPGGEAARVYLCEDVEPGFFRAYIFWHQT